MLRLGIVLVITAPIAALFAFGTVASYSWEFDHEAIRRSRLEAARRVR